MRTLLERLKEEHKKQLEVAWDEYPTTIDNLEHTMSKSISIIQLTVEDAMKLLMHTTRDLLSFDNLEILFENE